MIDNVVTTAVIIDPIRREEFSSYGGGGADLNNNKIRCSMQNNLEESMLSYAKSFSNEYEFEKSYKELAGQNLHMRESGCLSLDLAYVGTGRLDGVWAFDKSLIDIAAGSLIAQEGGALVSDFNGDPKFINSNSIISAAPKIYKSVLKSIKPYFKG